VANQALDLYEVDSLGLDRLDRQVLAVLCNNYSGRAVGLSTISVSVGEDQETIESVVEPFLVRSGLVVRTPKGRQATALAYTHLGLSVPEGSN
jgi:Holliday junction DNA helicase RuvB